MFQQDLWSLITVCLFLGHNKVRILYVPCTNIRSLPLKHNIFWWFAHINVRNMVKNLMRQVFWPKFWKYITAMYSLTLFLFSSWWICCSCTSTKPTWPTVRTTWNLNLDMILMFSRWVLILILYVIWTFTLKLSYCHYQTQKAVNARNIYGMLLCSKEKAN